MCMLLSACKQCLPACMVVLRAVTVWRVLRQVWSRGRVWHTYVFLCAGHKAGRARADKGDGRRTCICLLRCGVAWLAWCRGVFLLRPWHAACAGVNSVESACGATQYYGARPWCIQVVEPQAHSVMRPEPVSQQVRCRGRPVAVCAGRAVPPLRMLS